MLRSCASAGLSVYSGISEAIAHKKISLTMASHLIAKAIDNGHEPPEKSPLTRIDMLYLIRGYMGREMNHYALREIRRCLRRGHIDAFTLLEPIADPYIRCLIADAVTPIRSRATANSSQVLSATQLKKAADFVASLHGHRVANAISGSTYDVLIEKFNAEPATYRAARIGTLAKIALANNVTLSTQSWNAVLEARGNVSPQKALDCFRKMRVQGAKPDVHTFHTLLRILSQDRSYSWQSQRIVYIAKRCGIYSEFVAVEEMAILKLQSRYQDLLTVFAKAYGPEILRELGLGFTPDPVDKDASLRWFNLTPEPLSLAIDALVRLNPSGESVGQLYKAYKRIRQGASRFQEDTYSPSIFIRAFARHTDTLEQSMEILESMRTSAAKPTVVSYTSVIEGLTRHGMIDLATKVLEYMQADNVEPNEYTWDTLFRGYKSVNDIPAMKAAEQMRKKCEERNSVTKKPGKIVSHTTKARPKHVGQYDNSSSGIHH